MFNAILFTQWRWSKLVLLGVYVSVFALPILSVRSISFFRDSPWLATIWIGSIANWGLWYAALAAVLGLTMATTAWVSDHRGGHVYALSLPIERWRYVLLRYSAGVVLIVPAIVFLWAGGLMAVGMVELPLGLKSYATALALRFGFASLVAFSIFFAISTTTAKTAGVILATIGGLIVTAVLLSAANISVGWLETVFERVLLWPGPLEIFTGRWMLIDV